MTAVLGFLRVAWPYLLAGSVGFFIAWKIQAAEISARDAEFAQYKQEQSDAARLAQARLVVEGNHLTAALMESEAKRIASLKEKEDEIAALRNRPGTVIRVRVKDRCPANDSSSARPPSTSGNPPEGTAELDTDARSGVLDLYAGSATLRSMFDACMARLDELEKRWNMGQ